MNEITIELDEAAKHWNYIEKRLKEAEQTTTRVLTPAINELRYAGRQIVDAWSLYAVNPSPYSPEGKACLRHLIVARQYLVNADHDITDAIGLWLNLRTQQAERDFGAAFLRKAVPNFDGNMALLEELKKIIATSREQRQLRAAEYKRAADQLIPPLIKMFEFISMAEEIAIAREKRWQAGKALVVVIGIIGSVASVTSIAVEWDRVKALFHAGGSSSAERKPSVQPPAAAAPNPQPAR